MNADRAELFLNIASEGFWDWNLKSDRAYLSPRCCELIGISPDETISGSHFFKTIIHPDDLNQVSGVIADLKQGKRSNFFIEYRMISKDGSIKWVEGRGKIVNDEHGTAARLVGSMIDVTKYKKSDGYLKEDEEQFRSMVEHSPNLAMIHVDGKFIYLNQTAVSNFGIKDQQEYFGKSFIEVVHPDYRNLVLECVSNIYVNHKVNFNTEQKMLRKDGSSFWVELTCMPYNFGDKIAVHILAVDISDRKRVEKALLESEIKLWTILQSTADGILAVDRNNKLIHANQRFRELWQIPQDLIECGNENILLDFVSDQLIDPDTFLRKVMLLYSSEDVDIDTLCLRDGQTFELYSCPMIACGSTTGRVWSFRNISDQKQAEEALRESEALYRSIITGSPDDITITDMEGHILMHSPVAHTMFRSNQNAEEHLVGRLVTDFIVPEDRERAKNNAELRLQGNRLKPQEYRGLRLDGSTFDMEVNSEFIRDAEGRPVRMVYIVRDISDRKRAEEELQKKNIEIEQFIYSVSHDLRSPLVTVKTFLGFLENDIAGSDRERVCQDMQFIHHAADKMKLLLDELLEMSRIDRVEMPLSKVSLQEIVTEALDALAGIINERKVEIKLPASDLIMIGERSRLCQIWQNLIENAIKYSKDCRIPRIELDVQQIGTETVFFVRDNGIGIEPQYHGKIFGVFEKLNQKSPGAGLGLSMIQRIVEKCGGRIWVESEGIDKGSCFYFTLPKVMIEN